jgi:hypothetical protein
MQIAGLPRLNEDWLAWEKMQLDAKSKIEKMSGAG